MIGTSYHNMDAKGRLAMPAKLREALGQRFYVTIGRDFSLAVYSDNQWSQMEDKFNQLPYAKGCVLRPLFANAVCCEPDGQGRILLSQELREYAKIKKEVAVLGVGSRVEIWQADAWRAEVQRQLQDDNVFAAMEEMDF